ncbi:HSP20-like chaperone [Endogone sp. FLAS-F59071]|nr:HSP20-like chaperone [Endogone sp. FLAS-F59071]|eukprot:RUS21834.1 HSP20-like chaperone [Endogone sp. FLAS-F59071]
MVPNIFSTDNDFADRTLAQMKRMMNSLVDDVFGTHTGNRTQRRAITGANGIPELDIYNTQTEIIVLANIPVSQRMVLGVTKDKVIIETRDDNVLLLSGEASCGSSELDRNSLVLHERPCGKFSRAITLPTNINFDAIKANLVDGCLEIRVSIFLMSVEAIPVECVVLSNI